MKTAIKVIDNDFINFDLIGTIVNISMDTDEIKILFFQYSTKLQQYYIFETISDIMTFGMTAISDKVFIIPKDVMNTLITKPFEGWLIDKLKN